MEDDFYRHFEFLVLFASETGMRSFSQRRYTVSFGEWSATVPDLILTGTTEEAIRSTWRRSIDIAPGPTEALLGEMRAFRASAESGRSRPIDPMRPSSPKRSFLIDVAKTIIESLKDLPGINEAAKAAAGIIKELLEFLKAHFDSFRR